MIRVTRLGGMAAVAMMMATSCQKDLCNDHVHSTEIDVRFDWSLTKPDGAGAMYMVLMPIIGESMTRQEQTFANLDGGKMVAARGRYHAIALNRDGSDNEIYLDTYEGAYATTASTDVVSTKTFLGMKSAPLPAGSTSSDVRSQPSPLYADTCSVFAVDNAHREHVMQPKALVDTIDVVVEGVENLEYVIGMSAAISGMNSGVSLSRLEPMEGLCTVPMEMQATGATSIGGRMLTWGHCRGEQQKQQHVLTIYTMLVDGSKYYFNYDVSGQMHSVNPEDPEDPDNPEGPEGPDAPKGQRPPGHIVIDIPKLPLPLPTHSGGFQPEMGNWEEVEVDISM